MHIDRLIIDLKRCTIMDLFRFNLKICFSCNYCFYLIIHPKFICQEVPCNKKIIFLGTMSIHKINMFAAWCEGNSIEQKNACVLKFVLNRLGLREYEMDNRYQITVDRVKNFNSSLAKMWKTCNRSRTILEKRYCEWLKGSIVFFDPNENRQEQSTRKGRPCKPFTELGNQRKKQKIMPLLVKYSSTELTFAARKSLEFSGQRNASRIIKEVSEHSPERATKIKKVINSASMKITKYTPEEALGFFIDARLTKKSYVLMQKGAKYRNANIYPNYNILLHAKKKCYPDENKMELTDISAEVKLQALVNHTV